MAKVLKLTKSDGTIHVVPMANKAFYEAYNRRQKADKKWKLEEIDASEATKLPFKDPNHIKPADASKALADKDTEIERLKALLAAAEEKASQQPGTEDEDEDLDPIPGFNEGDEEPELIPKPAAQLQVPQLTRAEKQKLARAKAKSAKA